MSKGKRIRDKGKIRLSEYFKKFNENDKVAVVKEFGVSSAFPKRIVGKTGKVIGTRGNFIIIQINDGDKMKTFIIHPIHLKKLK